MPVGAIVAVAAALAAIVGLIGGAIWGLSESRSTTGSSGSSTAPSATSPSASVSAEPSADPTTPASDTPTASTTPSTAPSATGTAPEAPATTTTSADGWRLGSWRITNAGGTLGVDTTARNTATGTRSADLVLYVYVDGALIATTTARVTAVPAGGSVPVQFTGTDPWKPGQKVLLLQVP
jgi:hypothetical protein